jgi:hypothetical protein
LSRKIAMKKINSINYRVYTKIKLNLVFKSINVVKQYKYVVKST